MKIAYTIAPGQGDTDLLLERVATQLAAKGFRTCGTVQINTEMSDGPCDMDVRVLPDGPVLRISQNLGAGSRGCRLDPTILEIAVDLVSKTLDLGADLLIVNKFGKQEAGGRGFRTVIADALERDVPVIVGVSALNLCAFEEFAGSDIMRLAPNTAVISDWYFNCVDNMRLASGDVFMI
ncbi:DUF2478 domain-containing protein [Cochlodiniinecator piscidefendens]|uniref:DUF2478 domain-containing protein n=1 Tax=Cochlodiniinecator piscidefendens TaxID=2715756 RepID=UPI0014084EC0|nr:DUF2478 domain-containing protein [Cochlodiniinecator piscidefendens]